MINRLILDLDGTLYPSTSSMGPEIVSRMNKFVADYLKLDSNQAAELRRKKITNYGTTLEWLISEHAFNDVEKYYAFVHPAGEEESLEPDPELKPYLESLGLPIAIFTNSPSEHAERVIFKLGLSGLFDKIFDIRFCDYRGKPYKDAFLKVCNSLDQPPENCVFVDDMPNYIKGFIACGGKGILLDDRNKYFLTDMPKISSLYELKKILTSNIY